MNFPNKPHIAKVQCCKKDSRRKPLVLKQAIYQLSYHQCPIVLQHRLLGILIWQLNNSMENLEFKVAQNDLVTALSKVVVLIK